MIKDKKKLFIILAAILVIVIAIVVALKFLNGDIKKGDSTLPIEEEIVIPDAPSENTESLITELEKVETTTINNDVIEFSEKANIKDGDKVAVWVYSEPKFLGYFDVILENGVKMIKGLEKALKELKIESGEHNIAIVTEAGESIGYVDVYIEENKLFKDEKAAVESKWTTEEVKEEVEIKYQTETKKDKDKGSNYKEVTQKGVNGVKEITYKITYDETGKEIKKEKISEKVITKAINEIVVVGTADYNINTAKITTRFPGFMCSESQLNEYGCDDSQMLPSFMAIAIDKGPIKVVTLDGVTITPVTITRKDNLYVGTYKKQTYYFDARGGGIDPNGEPLTMEDCKEFNLSCGAW